MHARTLFALVFTGVRAFFLLVGNVFSWYLQESVLLLCTHERDLHWHLQECMLFFANWPRTLLGIYRSPRCCCACTNAICVGIYRSPCVLLLVSHAFCLVFTRVRVLAVHARAPFAFVFIEVRVFFSSWQGVLLGMYRSPCSCCARTSAICIGIYMKNALHVVGHFTPSHGSSIA